MATSPQARERYQAVVIGGGPAGSTAAWRLARAGRRVLLVERERFPRFHIGESLLPASNAVFRALGLDERVRGEGFVEKRGASFATEDGELSSYIDFTACPSVPAPLTYQVPRARFDQLLLEHADEAGVEVRQDCRAREVAFEPGGVTLELVPSREASVREASARVEAEVVIDASGQAGFLAKRLRLRRVDPDLRHVAAYAHFEGVAQPSGERAGDIRIVSRRDMSWIWLIPLSEALTSVGVVMPRLRPTGEKPEDLLDRHLAETPVVAEQVTGAKRVSQARYEADFCYAPRAYAGDRWLLAGDAGSFLDPVFSSGVLLALESGYEAGEAVDRALVQGDVSAHAFAAYQRTQRCRYRAFRRFVRGFYQPGFRDLFFHPTHRWGLLNAIVAALAGNWRPSLATRARLGLFFAMAAVQRVVPLVPRRHRLPEGSSA